MEADIRILVYLISETLNSLEQTIDQRGLLEFAESEITLDEYLYNFRKTNSDESHWYQKEFMNDKGFVQNISEKLHKIRNKEFLEKVKSEREEYLNLDLIQDKMPVSFEILPSFIGIIIN